MKNKVSNKSNLVSDVVFSGIFSVVKSSKNSWTGTMTQLTSAIKKVIKKEHRSILPGSPGALRVVVNKVVSRLRKVGVKSQFGRTTDHNRTRFVKFVR